MEFWANEVKSGETLKVEPGEGLVLHLSQANLGEIKKEKANESICLFVTVDGKKLVLGTLFSEKLPQQQFDLVFDQDFELSHNWKGGSVYFFGYRAANPLEEEATEEGAEFDSDSEEDIPLTLETNGKPETKAKEEKPAAAKKSDQKKVSAAGKKVTAEKGAGMIKGEDDDDIDESSENEDTSMDEDEDDSDSGDEDDSEEETPAKAESGKKKKRSSDAEPETPAGSKKVKLTTPQKTDGKKGGTTHVATPHPSKPAGKTPANQNPKTPKSGGSHVCKSCSRTFNTEGGLDAHTKAKHSAAK